MLVHLLTYDIVLLPKVAIYSNYYHIIHDFSLQLKVRSYNPLFLELTFACLHG